MSKVRDKSGKWLDSSVFRETGKCFLDNGYYCPDPEGSPDWFAFWKEERKRIIEGYEVQGERITGSHYYYLNFCIIEKQIDIGGGLSEKIASFPDFWDGDFNYFWVKEIARYGSSAVLNTKEEKLALFKLPKEEQTKRKVKLFDSLRLYVKIDSKFLNGNMNLIVGKARRRGYSLKAAAMAARNFYIHPNKLSIFAAYEKKYLYPKGVFSLTKKNINFMNQHTAFRTPSDYIDRIDHIKASFKEVLNGIPSEQGLMSEIMALSFKDNSDSARGQDAIDFWFEESGAFGSPGLLKSSYAASQDCVRAGLQKTGIMTIFGTSGDMESGTADYADMFERPEAFGLLPVRNIWDEGSEDQNCGFFHPINWNLEGYYDDQGNSDLEGARKAIIAERDEKIAAGATSTEMQKKLQELPLGPKEAFGAVSMNSFPVIELKARRTKVKDGNLQNIMGKPVKFYYEKGEVKVKMLFGMQAMPITSYTNLPNNKDGCALIYEFPVESPERGLYKIGYDPIRQEQGTSLASVVVYKSFHAGTSTHSAIVAEYIGRLASPDDIDQMSLYFAEFYSTQTMHENEVVGVKNYYARAKKLKYLAAQPDAVISKNIKKSKVARVYGCHMNIQLKDAGERYTKQWLLTILDYDSEGKPITVIDKINSIRLLDELIAYNSKKGNFDYISALFMCLFQVQEEVLGKEYNSKKVNSKYTELREML